jgi:hypothetical protein
MDQPKDPPPKEAAKTPAVSPPAVPSGQEAAAKPAAPGAQPDWWDDFQQAVEDPKVSTYGYLRDRLLQSLELDGAHNFSEGVTLARKKAVKELVGLTDPHQVSEKLKSMEGNTLIFSAETRGIMKVSRVLIDTYIAAHDECEKDGRHAHDNGCSEASHRAAAEKVMQSEMAADPKMAEAINAIAETVKHKDKAQVEKTLKQAAQQLAGDSARITQDIIHLGRAYLKPDNIANIMIHALPLISWEYRWALAVGLGAWSARKSGVHFAHAGGNLMRGKGREARADGAKAMRELQSAGAQMLLIGFTPLLAGLPALIIPPVTFVMNKCYAAVTRTVGDMLETEDRKPGSTPLSKGIRAKVGGFLKDNQDSLAGMGTSMLSGAEPSTLTSVLAQATVRMPLSKMRALGSKLGGVAKSLSRRFNADAREGDHKFTHEETRAILSAPKEARPVVAHVKASFAEVAAMDHTRPAPEKGQNKTEPGMKKAPEKSAAPVPPPALPKP